MNELVVFGTNLHNWLNNGTFVQCLYVTKLSLSLEENKTFIECTLHRMKTILKCNIV